MKNNPFIFISYVYFETEKSKVNLLYFLENGLDTNIHLFINCKSDVTIDLSKYKDNVVCYFTDNIRYDFGGHKQTFHRFKESLKKFKYFVMMNDTCIGPFSSGVWYNQFITHLKGETKVCVPYMTNIRGPSRQFPKKNHPKYTSEYSWGRWFSLMDYDALETLLSKYNKIRFKSKDESLFVERMNGKWIRDRKYKIHKLSNKLIPFENIFVKRDYFEGNIESYI